MWDSLIAAVDNVTRGINWISNFFINLYNILLSIGSFIYDVFDFILYFIKTIFYLFSNIL